MNASPDRRGVATSAVIMLTFAAALGLLLASGDAPRESQGSASPLRPAAQPTTSTTSTVAPTFVTLPPVSPQPATTTATSPPVLIAPDDGGELEHEDDHHPSPHDRATGSHHPPVADENGSGKDGRDDDFDYDPDRDILGKLIWKWLT